MCLKQRTTFNCVVWMKHIYHKYCLSHWILLLSYSTFLASSAGLFYWIEAEASHSSHAVWSAKISTQRNRFVTHRLLPEIFNNTRLLLYIHDNKSQYLKAIVNEKLRHYEQLVQLEPPIAQPCTYANSFIFIFSLVTTIGSGNIYPVTTQGRIFSIAVAVIGVPFTLIVIKDISYLLALLLHYPCVVLEKLWAVFRFCTLRISGESELERKWRNDTIHRNDYRLENCERLLGIPVTIAIFALIGWLTLGCVLCHILLPTREPSSLVYIVFNALATVGLGDLTFQGSPLTLCALFTYLLLGLSIVSLFINLLHSKFSSAYWLPGTLYMPLTRCPRCAQLASFDSFEAMTANDCPINHFTTLGILQADDKRSLIGVHRREGAYVDAMVQTDEYSHQNTVCSPIPSGDDSRKRNAYSHEFIHLQQGRNEVSQDDLHCLIAETYTHQHGAYRPSQ